MARSPDPAHPLPAERGPKRTGPIGAILPGDHVEVAREIQRLWAAIGRTARRFIDSTANAGAVWGVHSQGAAFGDFLRSDGADGSEWRGASSLESPSDVISAIGADGFWKLDELTGSTAADSSGNARHMTPPATPGNPYTAPSWADALTLFGSESALFGSAKGVSYSSFAALSGDLTLLIFAKPTTSHGGFLIGQGDAVASNGNGVALWYTSGGSATLFIGDTTGGPHAVTGDVALSVGDEYCIAARRRSHVWTLFINGVPQSGTYDDGGTNYDASTGAAIGNVPGSSTVRYFVGDLSCGVIKASAMTDAEILRISAAGVGVVAPSGYVWSADGAGNVVWRLIDDAMVAADAGIDPTKLDVSGVATEFLDGTGAFDSVTDSDLSTSDVTTNNASASKHGFLKKLSNSAADVLNGLGNFVSLATVAVTSLAKTGDTALVGAVTLTEGANITITRSSQALVIAAAGASPPAESAVTFTDITTNDASTSKHGYLKKLSGAVGEFLNGAGGWVSLASAAVTSVKKAGDAALVGDVTFTAGSNVTITQSGNDLLIAATVVGSGAVDSVAKSGSTPIVGAVTFSGGAGIALTQVGQNIAIAASSDPFPMFLNWR